MNAKHKKKVDATKKHKNEQFDKLNAQIEELKTQVTSFGLCLSAIVNKHGRQSDDNEGNMEYILRLADFHAISESQVFISTEPEIEDEPGTRITVVLKSHNGSQ